MDQNLIFIDATFNSKRKKKRQLLKYFFILRKDNMYFQLTNT